MILPPINSKGVFTFKEPFDKKLHNNQEYKVIAIRTLNEIYQSNPDPYETIYKPVGLSPNDFKEDFENDVPIVVFANEGNNTFVVPANRIVSSPVLSGVRYQEKVVAAKLGNLPYDYDLTLLLENINDVIKDTLGIETEAKVMPSSAIVVFDSDKHETFKRLLESSQVVNMSYKSKYLTCSTKLTELQEQYDELVDYVEKNGN